MEQRKKNLYIGWEPITVFTDRSKVSYFKRLSELPDSRLSTGL